MSHLQHLQELLRPLGVYDLSAPFHSGELAAQGQALDQVAGILEEVQREGSLATAQDWGLEQLAQLFARRPVSSQPKALAAALAALLRIGEDSFTQTAINDTLSGCGVPARAEEDGVGRVIVSFPQTVGVPAGFEEMRKIIEDILPAHLSIKYYFWLLTWGELEEKFPSWHSIQSQGMSWRELERHVKIEGE